MLSTLSRPPAPRPRLLMGVAVAVAVALALTPLAPAAAGGAPPTAVSDSITVLEGGTAFVLISGATSVLANDTDPESDPLTAVLVSGPQRGSLTLLPNGTFAYTHNGSETTSDSFSYRASDGTGLSAFATVTIYVTPVNDAPVAVDDSYTVPEDGVLTVTAVDRLTFNDTDAENGFLTVAPLGQPSHGTLVLGAAGTFTYTPARDYAGPDSFTYRASDGAALSNVATVSITVTPVDDAPVAVDDAITVSEGGTATTLRNGATSVLANDTDPESQPLTAVLVSGPSHGSLTLNADGTFSYSHDGSRSGADSFTYRAGDGQALSGIATVEITVTAVNRAPVAVGDTATLAEGGTATTLDGGATSVLANDTDVDGDDLTAVLVTAPAHGSLTLDEDGTFVYVHDGGQTTSDSFAYRAEDGTAGSGPVTVDLAITAVDDAPTITRIPRRVITENGRTGRLPFTVGDDTTPVSGLRVRAVADDRGLVPASAIRITGSGARRHVEVTPARDRWGRARITLSVTDATGAVAETVLALTVVRGPLCTITGTPGNDVLVGTSGSDVICGGGGDDVLRGLGGDDVLRGGSGDDRLEGGAGHDVLMGGTGADRLLGGAGNDTLRGGAGADRLVGGAGWDRFHGGPGRNSVAPGPEPTRSRTLPVSW